MTTARVARTVREMNAQTHCEVSPDDFDATVVETCDARIIRVTGRGTCPTAGWRLDLVAAKPGSSRHPHTIWLEVKETPPNEPKTASRSRVHFEAMIEGPSAREVVIQFKWREAFSLPLRERVPSFA